jgi:uncharacterized membrane-anchored protein YhcB (DUF1043 family)
MTLNVNNMNIELTIGVLIAGVVIGIISEAIYTRATNNFEQDLKDLKSAYQEHLDSYDRCLEVANEEIDKRQAELDETKLLLTASLTVLKQVKLSIKK